MIYQGRNLIIKLGGTAIAAAKTCSVKVDAQTIEVSSPTDGQWEHCIAGRKSWLVSVGTLVIASTNSSTPLKDDVGRVGQTYTLSFECSELSNDKLQGSALCKTFDVQGNVGALAQGNFTFQGSGPLAPPAN